MSTLRQLARSKSTGEFFLVTDDQFSLCPYTFDVGIPATEWIVVHNNDSTNLAIQVFIGDELVIPQDIVIDNPNQFTVFFSSPQAGYVNFVVYKAGNSCGVITP